MTRALEGLCWLYATAVFALAIRAERRARGPVLPPRSPCNLPLHDEEGWRR